MAEYRARDYREKTIRGSIMDIDSLKPHLGKVTVRMTSDNRGQTLSLQCANVQISIPLESVTDIIKVTERGDNNG